MLSLSEYPSFNYQEIITDIAFHAPENLEIKQRQWIYFHWDISYKFLLSNWKEIILRIWEKHMQEWNDNKKLSEEWKIFISGYLIDDTSEIHLPLYWWYENNDYEWIWNKALEN